MHGFACLVWIKSKEPLYLEEQAVAGLLVHGHLDPLGIRHRQIVTNQLKLRCRGVELAPVLPVVLVEGILDGYDWIVLDEGVVESGKGITAQVSSWVRSVLVLQFIYDRSKLIQNQIDKVKHISLARYQS